MNAMTQRGMVMLVLCLGGIGLSGCGEDPDQAMWEGAGWILTDVDRLLDLAEGDPQHEQEIHAKAVGELNQVIESNPAASDEIREFMTAIRAEQKQLAERELSPEEADRLRQAHRDYLEHIQRQQLPPAFE